MAAAVAAIADKEPLSSSPVGQDSSPNTDVTQHSKTPKIVPDDDNENVLLHPRLKKSTKNQIRHHRRKRPCCFLLYLITITAYCCIGAFIFMYIEQGQYKIDVEQRKQVCEELKTNITTKMNVSIAEVMALSAVGNMTKPDESAQVISLFNTGIAEIEDCLKSLTARQPKKLNFISAAFYCISVLTTVGYGDIIMETPTGRILTMFYALFGIPLYIAFVSDLGDILGSRIVWFGKHLKNGILRIRKSHPLTSDERSKNPHSYYRYGLVAFFLVILILLTSIMVKFIENYWGKHWTYLETMHFVFSTVTLIGFGDFVATHEAFIFVYLPFLVVGQTLVALCFYFSQRIIRYDVPHFITGCCLRSKSDPKTNTDEESSETTSTGPGFHGQGILSIKMHPPTDSSEEKPSQMNEVQQPTLSLGKFMPCVPGEPEEKSSTMTVFANTPYYQSFSLITTPKKTDLNLEASENSN